MSLFSGPFAYPALASLALVGLVAAPAVAQESTRGILQPHGDVAAGDHADAIGVNPAGIGFGERFQLAYTFVGSDEERVGQGHAAWLSLNLAGPYTAGLGVEWLELPGVQPSTPVKLTWAHALTLDPSVSIGFSWSHFFADGDADQPYAQLADLDTFDVGFQVRPFRWLAAGAVVTDLTEPLQRAVVIDRGDGREVAEREGTERGYEFGVAVRPGTERLDASVQWRIEEGDGDLRSTWGAKLRWRFFKRFALLARFDTVLRDDSDVNGQQLMIGLSDEGVAGGGLFWFAPDVEQSEYAGFAVTGRVRDRVEWMPSLIERPLVVEVEVGPAAEYGVSGLIFPRVQAPFLSLLQRLRRLEKEPEVAGVLLAFTSDQIGWAQAGELRASIARLRAAGKTVYAWLPVGDTRTYSVAAAADRVYTTHAGGVLLTGVKSQLTFIGTLLERLGIEAQFVGTGAYKSAPETFTRRAPSPAARLQQDALLDGIYGSVVAAIAAGRGLQPDKVREIIDGGPYTADAASDAGLVDGVIHYDEFEGVVREAFGPRAGFVEAGRLFDRREPRWGARPEIAVLYAVGTLVDGPSTSNPFTGALTTGSETIARAAEQLRLDSRVEAVVLRIDSPGGSVTASDVMWRALRRLAEEKPLIVSMGDVAASGGYYIAVAGRTILAGPDTITGSIGVFSGKFDLSGLYRGLGVETELFLRGKRAALLSLEQAWDDDERAAVQASMETLYDLFLERIATGRTHFQKETLEPLAGGRVWTGTAARSCGLVDRPEGLMTAIDLAAIAADIGDGEYELVISPGPGEIGAVPASPLGLLGRSLFAEGTSWADGGLMRLLTPAVEALAKTPLPPMPPAMARALTLPVLQFASGTPLALLPFAVQ